MERLLLTGRNHDFSFILLTHKDEEKNILELSILIYNFKLIGILMMHFPETFENLFLTAQFRGSSLYKGTEALNYHIWTVGHDFKFNSRMTT